ncbi:hypothetical protein SprV_0301181100 [Sparganum proliferum]
MGCLYFSLEHRISVVCIRRVALFINFFLTVRPAARASNCTLLVPSSRCVGLFYMAASTVLMVIIRSLAEKQSSLHYNVPTFLLIVGILACIVSITGFYAFQRTNINIVVIYALSLLGILTVLITITVKALRSSEEVYNLTERWLKNIYTDNGQSQKRLLAIYLTESQLQCCGLDGPSFYPTDRLSAGCCHRSVSNCTLQNAFPVIYFPPKKSLAVYIV